MNVKVMVAGQMVVSRNGLKVGMNYLVNRSWHSKWR